MLPEAAGRGQHFQAGGADPKAANNIFIFFLLPETGLQVCLRNFAIESAYAPSTNHSQKI